MMNEKDILAQIRNECRSFSPDNFERIKESISDNYENAEVISASEGVRFNRGIFIRFAVTAAVLFFPAIFTVRYFADHSADNGGNDYELMVPAVSATEETSVTDVTEAVAEITDHILTSAGTLEYHTVSETVPEKTQISENAVSSENIQKETVIQQVTAENVTQKPAETEAPAQETRPQIQETEVPEVTEPEKVTDAEEPAVTEDQGIPSVDNGGVPTVPAGTVRESFESELKLVPGFTDKIYRIKYNAEKADGRTAVYSVSGRNYRVESPDAYTICIYDVIIYGYDYFDFLSKGDYVLKTEYEYTVDEYFALEDKVLSVEKLISSGLDAVEE